MFYKCVSCDHVFDTKPGVKARCPKCLGIHDLEPVKNVSSASVQKRGKRLAPFVVLAVAIVVGVLYMTIGKDKVTPSTEEPDRGDFQSMLEEAGVPETEQNGPFFQTDKIEDFAEDAAAGKSGLAAMQALFDTISKLRTQGRWKPHRQREPRIENPLSAEDLLARLNKPDGTPLEALSYELSCLLLAAARSLDIDAKMAEIYRFKSEKKPADPGGKLGRYGVVVGEGSGEQTPPLFDLYGGRSQKAAEADAIVLSDVEAVAPYYGVSALSSLTRRDPAEALKLNSIAVKLAPTSPYFRIGRGLIFAASEAPGEALAEFEKAVKQRADAVTRTNLAELHLLADPTGRRAEGEIQAALAEMPDYARAHAILAMIHTMRRELEQAEQELAIAERLDPDSPVIAMFWAQLLAARAQFEDAINKAKDAVRLSGESLTSLMGLAGIYRATARFDEMRATLDRVVQVADYPGVAREIKDIFGYEPAGGDAEDEEVVAAGKRPDGGSATGLTLKLGGDDAPLGGGNLKLGDGLSGGGLKLGGGSGGLGGGSGGLGGGKKSEGLGGGQLKLDLNLKQ